MTTKEVQNQTFEQIKKMTLKEVHPKYDLKEILAMF